MQKQSILNSGKLLKLKNRRNRRIYCIWKQKPSIYTIKDKITESYFSLEIKNDSKCNRKSQV